MAAEPFMYKGLWQQAIDAVDQNLTTAWEVGAWNVVLWCSAWGAIANIKLGRLAEAQRLLDGALGTAARRARDANDSYPRVQGAAHRALGQAYAAKSSREEAGPRFSAAWRSSTTSSRGPSWRKACWRTAVSLSRTNLRRERVS